MGGTALGASGRSNNGLQLDVKTGKLSLWRLFPTFTFTFFLYACATLSLAEPPVPLPLPCLQTRIRLSTEATDLSIWGGMELHFRSSFWPNFNTEASLKVTSRKARVTMLVTTNAGLIPCKAVAAWLCWAVLRCAVMCCAVLAAWLDAPGWQAGWCWLPGWPRAARQRVTAAEAGGGPPGAAAVAARPSHAHSSCALARANRSFPPVPLQQPPPGCRRSPPSLPSMS